MSSQTLPGFHTLASFTLWFCLGAACAAQNTQSQTVVPTSPAVEQSLHELQDQVQKRRKVDIDFIIANVICSWRVGSRSSTSKGQATM